MSFCQRKNVSEYRKALKKILFHAEGNSACEYEYTNHLICFNNSYFLMPVLLHAVWAFALIAPYREERG